jgi:hypothetical protein
MKYHGHFVKSPSGDILQFKSDKAFREWATANHDTMLLRYIKAEKQEWGDVSYWKYEVLQ